MSATIPDSEAAAPAGNVEKLANSLKKMAVSGKAASAEKPTNGSVESPEDSEHDDDDDGKADGAGKKKRRPRKKKKKSKALTQTSPPTIPVSKLYPDGNYPTGEEVSYVNENAYRTTSEEKRELERQNSTFISEYRQAAIVHREVRQWARRELIKPGESITKIAEGIEDSVRRLTDHMGIEVGDCIKGGVGFPTGLSRNNCAAHHTPNAGNKAVLGKDDVLKVDIGVHINGRIVDSAFTWTDNPRYDNLVKAVKDATNCGVKEAGIDVRVGDIGAAIQEVMESYEIELDGKTYPIKAIRNLTGHNIGQWRIHGGKSVPIVKSNDQTKMEEGEAFAIETFGTTGSGKVMDDVSDVSHYSKKGRQQFKVLQSSQAKTLLHSIERNFGTLPFCRRYLDRIGHEKYLLGLNELVNAGIVEAYPALLDIKGSYTAQFEHTFVLRPTCKEVMSRGDDY